MAPSSEYEDVIIKDDHDLFSDAHSHDEYLWRFTETRTSLTSRHVK